MAELVYFIGAETGPIKIGKAVDVKKRLSGIQTGHPDKLNVLGVISGAVGLESELHQRFKDCHHRGEWFTRTRDLLKYIGENRNLSIYSDVGDLVEIETLDPDKHSYGPVEAIDGEFAGKIGYWDDDDVEIDCCAYCEGASKRGLEPDYECKDCETTRLAIVYFDSWASGWELVPYEDLRPLDLEIEPKASGDAVKKLFPNLNEESVSRILETSDVMTPLHDAEFFRRDVVKVLSEKFIAPAKE